MQYMRQLDGLRAVAIGSVMVEHFAGKGLNSFVPIGAGALGVNLFFALSGFLITGILLNSFDRTSGPVSLKIAWRNFYIKRFLRLAPALYLVLFLLAVLNVGVMRESWPWHASYLSNFYIAAGGDKTVFWSLAVEEQFYLFWPFVIAFVPRRHLLSAVVLVFVSALCWKIAGFYLGVPRVVVNVMLPGSFEPLAVGCGLAVLSYRGGKPNDFSWLTPRRRHVFTAVALACMAGATVVWLLSDALPYLRYFVTDGLMAVFYGWLVVMAARGVGGPAGWLLSHPVSNYVGRISYGLYIVHNFVPEIVEDIAGPLPKAVAAPLVLMITFGFCALSYRFFETPIRRLGERLSRPRAPEPVGVRGPAIVQQAAE